MRSMKSVAALSAAVLTLAACDDAGVLVPEGNAAFTVVMESEGGTPASSLSLALGDAGDPSAAVISLDVVESIFLPIGEVEALPAGDDGAWIAAGSVDETVDLLNLPEGGLTLLESALPQGEYRAFRFWLTADPTIVLSSRVRVGKTVYEPGEHVLVIPSADRAGLRLHASFVVDGDGETLSVLVDGAATVRKIVATGSGSLKMTPVLRVQNDDGDDVGEADSDDDSDDDDSDDDSDDGDEEPEAVEVEGVITGIDIEASSFTLQTEDGEVTVILDAETELVFDEGLDSWQDVADAVEAGSAIRAEAEGEWDDADRLLATRVEFQLDEE